MRRFLTAYIENDRKNPLRLLQPPPYWNAHVFSTKKVDNGLEVDTLQFYHQFEWNKEREPLIFGRKLILTVSK